MFLTGQCVELGGCSGDLAATSATLVCGPYPATPNIEAAAKKGSTFGCFLDQTGPEARCGQTSVPGWSGEENMKMKSNNRLILAATLCSAGGPAC